MEVQPGPGKKCPPGYELKLTKQGFKCRLISQIEQPPFWKGLMDWWDEFQILPTVHAAVKILRFTFKLGNVFQDVIFEYQKFPGTNVAQYGFQGFGVQVIWIDDPDNALNLE